MSNVVGAICIRERGDRQELSFGDILLNEALVEGDIWVREEVLRNVGGINYRLGAKRLYELLIRIAKDYIILQLNRNDAEEYLPLGASRWLRLFAESEDERMVWKTNCYLIGRYKEELLAMKCFDDAVLAALDLPGSCLADRNTVIQYLEQMITGTREFYDIYDCTQPILIYAGTNWTHNIADTFAGGLGNALEELGQCVEYADMSEAPDKKLEDYSKRRFKAVIGMGADVLFIRRENGRFVHDEITAPKYYFYFDHPIWTRELRDQELPHNLSVLVLDRNYEKFIKNYYGHPARFLPPAGSTEAAGDEERSYGIIFLGRYYGTRLTEILREIRSYDRKWGYLLNRYILYMRQDLSETPEDAFKRASEYYGITYTKEEFVETFFAFSNIFAGLAGYYRNKVIEALLEAGITLHVFGDTWKESPMWGRPTLVCHEAVSGKDALEVYARAKLSLNIMTWHKDGFTERIANAMLQKSVVVTDKSAYLEENFVNGEDLLMYDLKRLKELPEQIKMLLNEDERRRRIAENGYRKALKEHTWINRAGKLLEFIEEDKDGDR